MIRTDIKVKIKYTRSDIIDAVCESLPISRDELSDVCILRRTLNLSDKSRACYNMSVGLSLSAEREAGLLKMKKRVFEAPDYSFSVPVSNLSERPLVVGAGPAGLFAALVLAEAGARPVLIERGDPVELRTRCVSRFFSGGELDTESNVQFGEGGAGTFSDGKLKVGSYDKYKIKVLSEFVTAGAPEDITYTVGAHLGTDKLSGIVAGIRKKIIALGGEVIFRARLVDIIIRDGAVCGAVYEKAGERVAFDTDTVILAIGHSARDTFELLHSLGIPMQARGFGIGVRIEHPGDYIDTLVYGESKSELGCGASYHLVTHLSSGRSVYSFCMCPGGTVVAAASDVDGIVTNGMSEYLRDGENSNAAFLVSVTPDDFGTDSVLGGVYLQRKIEKAAYGLSQSYLAPAERMEDFKNKRASVMGDVKPTYPMGVVNAGHDLYLPGFVTDSLRAAIGDFDDWMGGFYYPDAVLTGPETRTTSPIRIVRDDKMNSVGVRGLYPIGEGAGYSGGIVSSGVDGVRCAECILRLNTKEI